MTSSARGMSVESVTVRCVIYFIRFFMRHPSSVSTSYEVRYYVHSFFDRSVFYTEMCKAGTYEQRSDWHAVVAIVFDYRMTLAVAVAQFCLHKGHKVYRGCRRSTRRRTLLQPDIQEFIIQGLYLFCLLRAPHQAGTCWRDSCILLTRLRCKNTCLVVSQSCLSQVLMKCMKGDPSAALLRASE